MSLSKREHLDFLFADAWEALTRDDRQVLLALSYTSGSVENLRAIAESAGRPLEAIEDSILAKDRFGVVRDFGGGDWEFVLHELAEAFLDAKRSQAEDLSWSNLVKQVREPSPTRTARRLISCGDEGSAWRVLQGAHEKTPGDRAIVRALVELGVRAQRLETAWIDRIDRACGELSEAGRTPELIELCCRWRSLRPDLGASAREIDEGLHAGGRVLELSLARAQTCLTALDARIAASSSAGWSGGHVPRRAGKRRRNEAWGARDADDWDDGTDPEAEELSMLEVDIEAHLGVARSARDELARDPSTRANRRLMEAGAWMGQIERGLERARFRRALSDV